MFDGPTGIVGPGEIRGRTWPMRATQRAYARLCYTLDDSPLFSL